MTELCSGECAGVRRDGKAGKKMPGDGPDLDTKLRGGAVAAGTRWGGGGAASGRGARVWRKERGRRLRLGSAWEGGWRYL